MKIQEAVSLIVPTRNEEQIVLNNLKLINEYLSGIFERYEIVVADYSEDRTPELVKSLSENQIHYVPVGEKGIGAGIRAGIEAARYDLLMVYPIDMSWNISCIHASFENILSNDGDVILGSRGCKESIVNRSLKRLIFSKIYNLLVNIFFGLKVRDTQCTVALRKSDIIPFMNCLDSKTPFLQTQLLIYSKINNLKIIEIPVVVNDIRKDSKISPIGDGFSMFEELINEYQKYRNFSY